MLTLKLPTRPSQPRINLNNFTSHNVDRYENMSPRSHVYTVPDMYIGSIVPTPREVIVLDMSDTVKMVRTHTSLPVGLERTFIEIISNTGDNVIESRSKGVDPGEINVTMDSKRISVRNGGLVIPIEINPQTGVYAPEMIFGQLFSSSNYTKNKQRLGAGRNGLGAKITNIYSDYFQVDIGDPGTNRTYRQVWQGNMKLRNDPIIEEGYQGPPFVQVTYDLEHEKFGYQEYPPEAFSLFARHCVDLAYNQRVRVTFNDRIFDIPDIATFAEYYFGSGHSMLIHYEWLNDLTLVQKAYRELEMPPDTDPMESFSLYWAPELVKKKNGLMMAKNDALPLMEVCVIDTPGYDEDDDGQVIAFVNGIINSQGGIHATAVFDAIKGPILTAINSGVSKLNKKSDRKPPALTVADLKRNVSIIVSLRTINTTFNSQSKDILQTCGLLPKLNIPEERFKCVDTWKLKRRLVIALEAKLDRLFAKTDGKKKSHVFVNKAEPANKAGKGLENSKKCLLILTEGDSAMMYAIKLFENLMGKNFRDYCGFFPLRGKLLNVREANPFRILDNKEITSIKKLMGLKEKVDYTREENLKQLRYWQLVIIADPDVDGKHIAGLVINWLDVRFDGLLKNGLVSYVRVPIIRAIRGKEILRFYSLSEVTSWQNSNPNHDKYKLEYFKGLGTSTDANIKEDSTDFYRITYDYDDKAGQHLKAAFDPNLANERKNMIENYTPDFNTSRYISQAISLFIEKEVIEFSVANVQRSIPAFSDGLKKSQRQILFAAFEIWGKKIGKGTLEPMKVARFGPEVARRTEYHHGEDALAGAIIKMAQDYVGANNLNYFFPKGQFGTRNKNGKDASASRYIFTYPMWWLRLVFREEDDDILTHVIEEGKECEYERFYPIIPTSLINGIEGIGTGFSSSIPPYNPLDLCLWLVLKLNSLPCPYLKPWYRGFKGKVKIALSHSQRKKVEKKKVPIVINLAHRNPKTSTEVLSDDAGEDYNDDESMDVDHVEFDLGTTRCQSTEKRYSVYTKGVYRSSFNETIVTELPIGRSIHGYKDWLETLVKKGDITEFSNHSTPTEPHFTITGMKNVDHRTLRLIRSFPLTNMVLLDENNQPRYYKNVDDILESFYVKRLYQYQRRKESLINKLNQECKKLADKAAVITEIVEERLEIRNRPLEEIYAYIEKMGINAKEVIKQINLRHLSHEDIEELHRTIAEKQHEIVIITETSLEIIWEREIVEFVTAYLKRFPDERNRLTDINIQQTMLAPFYTDKTSVRNIKLTVSPKRAPILKIERPRNRTEPSSMKLVMNN